MAELDTYRLGMIETSQLELYNSVGSFMVGRR